MKNYDSLSYIIGSKACAEKMIFAKGRPLSPFAEQTLDFLQKWSDAIRSLEREKNDPATAAFGFWCRRASLLSMKSDYADIGEGFAGRGVCLQFVPDNIPALFAYSLAAALLAGNSVIMRLPHNADTDNALISTLKIALEACSDMAGRVILIKYPHNREITDWLSARCDVRVIWGGNSAVDEISRSKLKEGAAEIVFPDRHSMAVIAAEDVLKQEDLSGLIRDFFNDTYLNDQNACSSPNIIFWLGRSDAAEKAKERFWEKLSDYLRDRVAVQDETAVKKQETAMLMAGNGLTDKIDPQWNMAFRDKDYNIVRVRAETIGKELWKYASGGGFFIECSGENVEDIAALLNSSVQTIACWGNSRICQERVELTDCVRKMAQSHGSFRVVPAGRTLDFSLCWDGQDLIRQMCEKLPQVVIVENEGCSLYAKKQGSGPYLLLIHGVAVDSEYFNRTARDLEKDFTVITYDRRGYSRSVIHDEEPSKPAPALKIDIPEDIDRELKTQITDAAAVIECLAEGGPVTVCGCSAGGLIAAELARSCPWYVNRLFLYEAAYTADPDYQKRIDEWKEKLDEAAAGKSMARAMLAFIQAIGRPDEEAIEKSPELIQRNMDNLALFLEEESASLLGYSKRHPDIRLKLPCIIGAGTFDRGNLFYDMMKQTAGLWQVPFTEVKGCHNACEDRPAEFASWIRQNCDIREMHK